MQICDYNLKQIDPEFWSKLSSAAFCSQEVSKDSYVGIAFQPCRYVLSKLLHPLLSSPTYSTIIIKRFFQVTSRRLERHYQYHTLLQSVCDLVFVQRAVCFNSRIFFFVEKAQHKEE